MLPSFKFSSEINLHNMTMLSDLFSVNTDIPVSSWSALTCASHYGAQHQCLHGVFWVGYGSATPRTILGGFESVFWRVKRLAANLALKCFSVTAFKAALLAKSLGNIISLATSTAILLAGSSGLKFVFTVLAVFGIHVCHHSHCGVRVKPIFL